MTEGRRSVGKRLLASAVLLVLLAVFSELLCLAAWRITEGRGFSYAEVFARRSQLAAAVSGEQAAPPPEEAPVPGLDDLAGIAGHFRGQVIHPFVGYVYTPEWDLLPGRRTKPLRVGEDGFFYLPWTRQVKGDPLHIAVFGGSVAFVFSFRGAGPLTEGLAASIPAVAERGAVVVSRGLGGWKQPQQLMALAWMMARGEPPDAVINLDGFNEVALPAVENVPRGTYPFYPRGWEARVRQAGDLERRAREGEVEYLRRRRAATAASFSRPVLRWSVSWNFLWRWLDRRAEAAVAVAQQRLTDYQPQGRGSYVATGPAWESSDPAAMYDELAAFWERSSVEMKSLCDGAGIPYFHFLQPNQYLPGSKPLSAEERRTAYRENHHYRQPVSQGYPRLLAAGARLEARGIEFHDLTQLFADEERTVYQDECCHLNDLGNRLMAAAVLEAVTPGLAAAWTTPAEPHPTPAPGEP